MNELWLKAVISEIKVAMHVDPGTGRAVHNNRPFHGFVFNDSRGEKTYTFDTGRVMRTDKNCLFYLPKGSSYHVRSIPASGCYAINFDADISDEPFSVTLRNPESVLRNFKAAASAWKQGSPSREAAAKRAIYDAICTAHGELHRQYAPKSEVSLIDAAVRAIDVGFTENDLSISHLAELCGISEVYLRRLFLRAFGVSPKEYVIQKRINYAKSLLGSGDFSVSEVAVLCGYSEPCHFSREFVRRTGITPSHYINS